MKVYDATGKYLRTVDLAQSWKRQPNYPSGIARVPAGGVVIHDFHGRPPVVQMRLDGHVVRQFEPAFKDGRVFDIHGHVQVADDGTYWTSDGSAILQLGDKGIVTHIVGEKPSLDVLGEVAAMTVSSKGWIYAADARSGAVHVFDADGKQHHVCRPDASDYQGRLSLPSLTVSEQGDVFISRREVDADSKPDFLHYAADGRRIGVESSALDDVTQSWYSQPGTLNRWIVGYTSVYLTGPDGRVLGRSDRQANGQWLEQPGPVATGPDGSIVIVSGDHVWPAGSAGDVLVTLYSAGGEPRDTWPVPAGFVAMNGTIAYDGEQVAFLTATNSDMRHLTLVLENVRAHRRKTFSLPATNDRASVFLVERAATAEVWLFDGGNTLHRFEMPPAI